MPNMLGNYSHRNRIIFLSRFLQREFIDNTFKVTWPQNSLKRANDFRGREKTSHCIPYNKHKRIYIKIYGCSEAGQRTESDLGPPGLEFSLIQFNSAQFTSIQFNTINIH